MTFSTKPKPIIKLTEVLMGFIGKMNTLWSSFKSSAKFTNISSFLSAPNPSMQGSISNLITFPIYIFFCQSPNINFSSNPRFMPHSILIANKTFRNALLSSNAWLIKFSSPFPEAFMGTVLLPRVLWVHLKPFLTIATNTLSHVSYYNTTVTVYSDKRRRVLI